MCATMKLSTRHSRKSPANSARSTSWSAARRGIFRRRRQDVGHGFKSVIDIDLLGTFNSARAAFEYLRKPGAAVINISAPQASVPMAYQSHVCAGKAGVDMITRTLAIEWGPLGIRVNSVVPGPIADTEGMKRLTPTPEMAAALANALPLQRYGEKEEIADLAMFLASDAAKYITGAVVPCDGGSCLVGSGAWVQAMAGAVR